MTTHLRFVSLGLGHVVCANKIYAVMRPDTEYAKRIIRESKANGTYMDWRRGKPVKSLVIMDDGKVIACFFTVGTVYSRLKEATRYDDIYDMLSERNEEEDEEDEDQ